MAASREIGPQTGIEAVVLFGSVQQGTAHARSDCDLAVIERTEQCSEARRRLEEAEGEAEFNVIEVNPEKQERDLRQWGSVAREALTCGEVIWGEKNKELEQMLSEW